MRLKTIVLPILVGCAVSACTTSTSTSRSAPPRREVVSSRSEIIVRPPEPRVVLAPAPRKGYVWAPGFWRWNGRDYDWVDGRWIRERKGERWIPAHWEERGDRWHFEQGHWER
jgi:hypothetical protein